LPTASKWYLAAITHPKSVPRHSNPECLLKPPKIDKVNDFTKLGSKCALSKRLQIWTLVIAEWMVYMPMMQHVVRSSHKGALGLS
jgi:hypothetical protein